MDTGRFPVAVTTETTTWAVRDDRRLWYDSIRLSVWPPTPTHWWCVWLVVGLGVDRIVDARVYRITHPPPHVVRVCWGVLLFVSAY